jgi:hypothetical protein
MSENNETVDPSNHLACLEKRIRELESEIRGCKTDIRVLAVGLILVFLAYSRLGQAVLASLGAG